VGEALMEGVSQAVLVESIKSRIVKMVMYLSFIIVLLTNSLFAIRHSPFAIGPRNHSLGDETVLDRQTIQSRLEPFDAAQDKHGALVAAIGVHDV
jgi:hypothetical protein